jgi:hypothetical protein
MLRARKPAGIANDCCRRRRQSKADVQGHHRTLAEADEREPVRRQRQALEFGIEKREERGFRHLDTTPIFGGVAHGQREPLPARLAQCDRHRRVGGDECGARQDRLPCLAQRNEIAPIGPVTVKQHDQGIRLARGRLDSWSFENRQWWRASSLGARAYTGAPDLADLTWR